MSQTIATTSNTTPNSTYAIDRVDAGTVSLAKAVMHATTKHAPAKHAPAKHAPDMHTPIRTRVLSAARVFICQAFHGWSTRWALRTTTPASTGTFFAEAFVARRPSAHESAPARARAKRLIVGPIPAMFCCTGLQYQIVN